MGAAGGGDADVRTRAPGSGSEDQIDRLELAQARLADSLVYDLGPTEAELTRADDARARRRRRRRSHD